MIDVDWLLQLCDHCSGGGWYVYMHRALPLGVGVGKEGKIKRQDHLTCLNQNRQVEISLHSCEISLHSHAFRCKF